MDAIRKDYKTYRELKDKLVSCQAVGQLEGIRRSAKMIENKDIRTMLLSRVKIRELDIKIKQEIYIAKERLASKWIMM